MAKTLTLFLTTTPYAFQNTATALKLAEAGLKQGYEVNLFASADGVHNFTPNQQTAGVPNAEQGFRALLDKGLNVELCGSCLRLRGIEGGNVLPGSEPSSMKKLFAMVGRSDVFITLGT